MKLLGEHCIVIGGSIGGLIAARVLADRFERVTIVDRDAAGSTPEQRRPVPQGAHIHALLLAGERVLSALFPGFTATLLSAGALPLRAGVDVAYFLPEGKAYSPGGAMRQPRDLGFDLYSASRELIEQTLRKHTLALPRVRVEPGTVQGLLGTRDRIDGVRCDSAGAPSELRADFVVDSSGRGSRTAAWLGALGVTAAPETLIGVDMAYASAKFELRDEPASPERQWVFRGPPPTYRRSAILARIEGGQWHVTLGGRFGDDPPYDPAGFMAFVRSLHSPRLHEAIGGARRITDIVPYKFPSSVRRHCERMPALPERWLALGDAICSFNPVYGQGMSVAALHGQALRHILDERAQRHEDTALDGVGLDFFAAAAGLCEQPWSLAASQDFAFPQTRGERPAGLAERRRYAAVLESLIPEHPTLHRLLAEVVNLTQPSSAVGEEPWRSLAMARLAGGQSAA